MPDEPPDELVLTRVTFAELTGWNDDSVGDAVPALLRSCGKLARKGDGDLIGRTPVGGHARDWRAPCAAAAKLDAGDHDAARRFFEKWFTPYAAANRDQPVGRFTGYYEASLRGSRTRKGRYRTPIYGRPPDLVEVELDKYFAGAPRRRIAGRVVRGKLEPYSTRKQIDGGALAGKGIELLWVDDPVDRFFAEVQGSGRVQLDDGTSVRIGVAGMNGHPYTAIGRVLIAEGALTQKTVSMQSIRAWLEANPKRADAIMHANEAFIFFAIEGGGPYGSQGVTLTPERSLAIDRDFVPLSTPIWVDTSAPVAGDDDAEEPWRKLLIAQDTGGAIRGPVRGDIYFGGDRTAYERAGRMKGRGRYFLLVPRTVAVPTGAAASR